MSGLRVVSPAPGRLSGLVDLEVEAPPGTSVVRLSLSGMRLATLTDAYARGTGQEPVWWTATDAAWLPPGQGTLRVEADTPVGLAVTEVAVDVVHPPAPAGTWPLVGGWRFAAEGELPAGALDGGPAPGAGPPSPAVPPVADPDTDDGGWQRVVVPGTLGAIDPRWDGNDGLRGAYRCTVDLPAAAPGERTWLCLDELYLAADVYLGGQHVGSVRGGYLPARLDLTGAVRAGENQLTVVVDHRASTMAEVPFAHYYYVNDGGLVGGARIERTAGLALLAVRAEGTAAGQLTLRASGVGAGPVRAEVTVTGPDGAVARQEPVSLALPGDGPDGTGDAAPVVLDVPGVRPWSPADPALYEVAVRPVDPVGPAVVERTGFRDVAVAGDQLLLNGQPLSGLLGVNRHRDVPGLHRTEPAGLVRRELAELRAAGYTLLRPGHYPTTPGCLDACDELGILVIEEVNVIGQPGAVLATEATRAFGRRQLERMIRRDRSHPSVVVWSVGNENHTELPGADTYVDELVGHGRALDPSRLYTQVTHRLTKDITFGPQDLVAMNLYAGWYERELSDAPGVVTAVRDAAGGKPVVLSEFGAEARAGHASELAQARYVDGHAELLAGLPGLVGTMYWTSHEFRASPTWAGGSPDPMPPFHGKGLVEWTRRHRKLAWRVSGAPVRLEIGEAGSPGRADPAGQGRADPAGQRWRVPVTVRATAGHDVDVELLAAAPAGLVARPAVQRLHVAADAPATVELELHRAADAPDGSPAGTPARAGSGTAGLVRAVVVAAPGGPAHAVGREAAPAVLPDPDPVPVATLPPGPVVLPAGRPGAVPLAVRNPGPATEAQVDLVLPDGWWHEEVTVALPAGAETSVDVPVVAPPAPTTVRPVPLVDGAPDGRLELRPPVTTSIVTVPGAVASAVRLGPGWEALARVLAVPVDEPEWVAAEPRPPGRSGPVHPEASPGRSRALRLTVPAGPHRVLVLAGDPGMRSNDTVLEVDGRAVRTGTELARGCFRWVPLDLPAAELARDVVLHVVSASHKDARLVAALVTPR